jgi:hypothetical protein
MDPVFVGVVVGALGTTLIGAVYFLWVRADKKPQPQQAQQQAQPQQ